MFVTRITLRGMTLTLGSFSIHAALLLAILLYYPEKDFGFNKGVDDYN